MVQTRYQGETKWCDGYMKKLHLIRKHEGIIVYLHQLQENES